MKTDIIINKTETIKRCIERVQEEYDNNPENLTNYTKQDSIILNIQRLCEASLDLAIHTLKKAELGVPQSSKDSFKILEQNDIISKELCSKLQAMVGFRNIAVHDYQAINLDIVKNIVEMYLFDALDLADAILEYNPLNS